jgi:hypothetical protein
MQPAACAIQKEILFQTRKIVLIYFRTQHRGRFASHENGNIKNKFVQNIMSE